MPGIVGPIAPCCGLRTQANHAEAASFCDLFRNGWTIGRHEDNPVLVRRSGISNPASFKNDSVVIQARFRRVEQDQHARALEVDVPPTWFRTVNNYPVIRTNGTRFVDPPEHFLLTEFPCRTTLSFDFDRWEQVERCCKLFTMENRCAYLGALGAVAVLTPRVMSSSRLQQPQSGGGASSSLAVALQPTSTGAGGVPSDPSSEASPQPAPAQPAAQAPPPLGGGDVVHVPDQTSVVVDGVTLTVDSAIASLRAGCKHVGTQLEVIEGSRPLAAVVHPRSQQLAVKPTDEAVIQEHELTHCPYQAWCEACVANKALADVHPSQAANKPERAVSVVSFDLFYREGAFEC